MQKQITSVNNEEIKFLTKLKNKKDILECGFCFAESEKIVLDLLKTQKANKVFITIDRFNKHKNSLVNQNVFIITEQVSKKICTTNTPSGMYATFNLPKQTTFDTSKNFLVLDTLQDPNNLGAIIRCALAFNVKNIVLINSVYPFTPKSIRASMGYVFDVNFFDFGLQQFIDFKNQNNLYLISANLNGQNVKDFKTEKTFGLIIGNEGNGVSEELQNLSDSTVTIKMHNNVESLNASVSAAVILHNLI